MMLSFAHSHEISNVCDSDRDNLLLAQNKALEEGFLQLYKQLYRHKNNISTSIAHQNKLQEKTKTLLVGSLKRYNYVII